MTGTLWNQKENYSTYYDRELDLQGEVPGRSRKEALEAFQRRYGKKPKKCACQ